MPASSTVYYHVTPTCNVPRIMREGLLPRRGPRSRRLGESREAVYLFKGREAAADGLANWLGDEWFRQLDLAPFDGLNWPHLEACDLSFRVGLGGRSP